MNDRERLWHSMFLSMPQAMIILDQYGTIEFVNKAWLNFVTSHGLPEVKAEAFVGMSYLNGLSKLKGVVLNEEAYAVCLHEIGRNLEGKDAALDYPCLSANGKTWLSFNLTKFETGHRLLTWTDTTDYAKNEQDVTHLVYVDPLTGLHSRSYFMHHGKDLLKLADRQGQSLHLLFLDLDGFRMINNQFGHDVGDGLLKEVAKRFKIQTRESDLFARFGGDEFIALLDGNGDIDAIAERYRLILNIPFKLADQTRKIGVSMGTASFPSEAKSLFKLIQVADERMYQSKKEKFSSLFIENRARVLKDFSLNRNLQNSGLWGIDKAKAV